MCTNNYSNRERFDTVIAKIIWCSFLPHSVLSKALLRRTKDVHISYTKLRNGMENLLET